MNACEEPVLITQQRKKQGEKMSFTYEAEDGENKLERYEWDNVWWEQTLDTVRPRVLYIGDSISCNIRQIATRRSNDTILFDGVGTSKAVDNEYFQVGIQLFGKQQKKRNVVLFNNGLHGFHLNDTDAYKKYYEEMVRFLLQEFHGTAIALVLTTCVIGERNQRVIARNSVVKRLAEKYELPVIDLYEVSEKYLKLISDDGVHFTQKGYEKLADGILAHMEDVLKQG